MGSKSVGRRLVVMVDGTAQKHLEVAVDMDAYAVEALEPEVGGSFPLGVPNMPFSRHKRLVASRLHDFHQGKVSVVEVGEVTCPAVADRPSNRGLPRGTTPPGVVVLGEAETAVG